MCLPSYTGMTFKLNWYASQIKLGYLTSYTVIPPDLHWGISQVTLGFLPSYIDVPPKLYWYASQVTLECLLTHTGGTFQLTLGYFPSYTRVPPKLHWCTSKVTLDASQVTLECAHPTTSKYSKFTVGIWFYMVCNSSHVELSFPSGMVKIPKIFSKKNRL